MANIRKHSQEYKRTYPHSKYGNDITDTSPGNKFNGNNARHRKKYIEVTSNDVLAKLSWNKLYRKVLSCRAFIHQRRRILADENQGGANVSVFS